MRTLKVFGVNLDGIYRGVVAATSQAKAAAALGTTLTNLRDYGCETRAANDVEVAMREPGKAWKRRYYGDTTWRPVAARQAEG